MPLLKEETHTQQSRLAEYCKTGVFPELTGVIEDNLHHYRRLVFNIGIDTIETAYPITYRFLPNEIWDKLVYDFYAKHKCQTPQVWRMPLEFYEYCVEKNIQAELNIPFLNDLLYFEWLELEMHTMEDVPYPSFNVNGDSVNDVLALNPEHKLVKFAYPVHILAPTELEGKAGDYFLLMYREKENGRVQCMDVSILYAYILEQLQNGVNIQAILTEADTLFQINNFEMLKEHALIFINDLQQRQFILGSLTS
ncbi:MAG: putative DNA-binding domain-containing protein [Bacteroidetes bacterium]|nr:putative DNA-binding domain-containing protein [Bacteroidota bacterium]